MKSQVADRYMSVPMTLSDLERRDTRVKFFSRITSYRLTWTTKIGRITHAERIVFLGVSHAPTARGRCPSARQFCGFLSIYAYTLCRRTKKFDVVTHMRRGQPSVCPKGLGSSAPQFWGFVSICVYTLWRVTNKFDVVTHMGTGFVLGGQPCPTQRG